MARKQFFPEKVFSTDVSYNSIIPKVLNSPHKYIQSAGALNNLGLYLTLVESKHAAVLITAGGDKRFGEIIAQSLKRSNIKETRIIFQGECTLAEMNRVIGLIEQSDTPVDTIVAIGGGKCLDTARGVAYSLSLNSVMCPTTASTDAPCSGLSVIYSDSGECLDFDLYPLNPTLVIVDTKIAAEAPFRFIVSGLGDAMATWYEARTCFENPSGLSLIGTRPTLVGLAIAKLCANTLYDNAPQAIEAVKKKQVNDAVERVVEANTLMSGLGFESCGLAAAHAIGQGLTVFPHIHKNYLHGEMVAFGLVAQLLLEDRKKEAEKVAAFFVKVGLPVHLGQVSLDNPDIETRKTLAKAALDNPIIKNEPFEVTEDMVVQVVQQADEFGREISKNVGDAPYRAIHG